LLFASNFGGDYLVLGCILLLLLPIIGVLWIALQVWCLLSSDRASILSLLFMLAFSGVPGFLVVTALPASGRLAGFSKFLVILSVVGLVLLPVTLVREFLKFLRDRPPRRHRRRRRQGPHENRTTDQTDDGQFRG
jgi:hypothetical protein